jgi:hypothetical protein
MYSTLVGVYWPSRGDDLQLCADNAAAHFRLLRELGPGLDQWFHKSKSWPSTPSEADIGTAEVRELLRRGVNKRDYDKTVIAELGWSLSLWNGESGGLSA